MGESSATEPFFYTVSEARKQVFPMWTESHIRQLVAAGSIPSVRFSPRRILIPRAALRRLVDDAIARAIAVPVTSGFLQTEDATSTVQSTTTVASGGVAW